MNPWVSLFSPQSRKRISVPGLRIKQPSNVPDNNHGRCVCVWEAIHLAVHFQVETDCCGLARPQVLRSHRYEVVGPTAIAHINILQARLGRAEGWHVQLPGPTRRCSGSLMQTLGFMCTGLRDAPWWLCKRIPSNTAVRSRAMVQTDASLSPTTYRNPGLEARGWGGGFVSLGGQEASSTHS